MSVVSRQWACLISPESLGNAHINQIYSTGDNYTWMIEVLMMHFSQTSSLAHDHATLGPLEGHFHLLGRE